MVASVIRGLAARWALSENGLAGRGSARAAVVPCFAVY